MEQPKLDEKIIADLKTKIDVHMQSLGPTGSASPPQALLELNEYLRQVASSTGN